MQLVRNGRFIADCWQYTDHLPAVLKTPTVVPYVKDIERLFPSGSAVADLIGLSIAPDIGVEALRGLVTRVALIVIEFAERLDGRGFSTAVNCRRLGFCGELRVRGRFIPDQYHHIKACGIDSIALPFDMIDRHTELQWRKAFSSFPLGYQERSRGLSSIINLRHTREANGENAYKDPHA